MDTGDPEESSFPDFEPHSLLLHQPVRKNSDTCVKEPGTQQEEQDEKNGDDPCDTDQDLPDSGTVHVANLQNNSFEIRR
jgi:hypothetical protein